MISVASREAQLRENASFFTQKLINEFF